jgi:hypothetical protein
MEFALVSSAVVLTVGLVVYLIRLRRSTSW